MRGFFVFWFFFISSFTAVPSGIFHAVGLGGNWGQGEVKVDESRGARRGMILVRSLN